MKTYAEKSPIDLPVYSESFSTFDALTCLRPPRRYFTLLIAGDATGLDDDAILSVARSLIDRGLVYLCAWGPDCERVHDLFDRAAASLEGALAEQFYMTNWHADEPLREALSYLLNTAFPADDYFDECAAIAVSIGNNDWAKEIEAALRDIPRFEEEMLRRFDQELAGNTE